MTRTVLNTRPREQAAELSRLLMSAGFAVLEAPAIETVPAWDPAALDSVRAELGAGRYTWVVLPSQNAGRLLVDALVCGHARVVCGAATAAALGLVPELALDRFSATEALALLRPMVQPGQPILVPRAAEGSPELVDGLAALRARVHAPIAYRTALADPSTLVEAAARLRRGEVHAVTVCSPSAITSLLAAVGRESLIAAKLICLGQTTAEAARQAGLRVDGVAEQTTMAALVEAVRAVLSPTPLARGGPSAPAGTLPAPRRQHAHPVEVPSGELTTGESLPAASPGGADRVARPPVPLGVPSGELTTGESVPAAASPGGAERVARPALPLGAASGERSTEESAVGGSRAGGAGCSRISPQTVRA